MKNNYPVILPLFLLLFFSADIFSQGMYDTYSGFTTPAVPVLPSSETHPSLFFSAAQVPELISRKTNPAYASIWKSISSNIKKFSAMKITATNESSRPKLAKYCAFDWIMNGSAASRDAAVGALMAAYDNVPRTALKKNFDKPYDEIYRATWLQNYAEAYDWIFDQLSPAQNDTIRRKLAEEADLLCDNMRAGTRYAPRPHNHRSKPAYGLGTIALTLASHPKAPLWLDSALTNINTVTKYQFSSDGIYREGAHYYMYSLVNEIPFLWHYKNVSGVDLFPYYQASFEWPILIRDQRGWLPNNEDGHFKPAPTQMVAKAYLSASTRLHASEPFAKICQWNWAATKYFTPNYTGADRDVCWDIDEFLTYDPSIPSVAPSIDPTLKLSTGQVVFRNGWENADSTMRYLLFLAAAAGDNHDHPDALSYIINARNTCLAVDAGYGQDEWNHASWYLAPFAHNLVTTNDEAPSDFVINQTPPDRHFLTTPFIDFSEKEARTPAAGGTIQRGIAFVDHDYWIVYDASACADASTVSKLFVHGRGTMQRTDDQITWSAAADKKYGSAANLHAVLQSSHEKILSEKSGNTCLCTDAAPQQYIEAEQKGDTSLFVHLLSTSAESSGSPIYKKIESGTFIGGEMIRQNGIIDRWGVQSGSQLVTSGDCSFDGKFGWWRRTGTELRQFMLVEGKIFRWNNIDLLASFLPVTVAADLSCDSVKIFTFDLLEKPAAVILELQDVAGCSFNDAPVTFSRTANDGITVTIPSGGKLAVKKKLVRVKK